MARAAPARRASRTRRILGWAIDLGFLASLLAAHVVLAARLAGAPHQRLSLVFAAPLLWLALGCGLALAWSWTFVALWGRTPGMALTGQRLRMLHGIDVSSYQSSFSTKGSISAAVWSNAL